MNILVLNYEYPPVGGGGGRLSQKLAEALVSRGHHVRVVAAGMSHLPREEVVGGVEVFRPRSFRRREDTCSVPEMGMYLATAFPEALRQAGQSDVMHAHFIVPTGPLAWSLHKLTGIPYMVTAHLGDVPGGVPEQTGHLFRLAAPAACAVWHRAAARTAVSSFVAGLAEAAFGATAEVIPNGIPAIARNPLHVHRPVKLLMVGRLSVQKNPLLAVASLARLAGLGWELEVIGQGPLEPAMRDASEAAGLSGRIQFSGWMDESGVRARMAESDILLMPSLHEGLPMAAVEALWHGLAIVGSHIGGLADVVIDGRNGHLCELTPEAFAFALAPLLSDPKSLLPLREASLLHARNFDFEKSVDAYEKLLEAMSKPRS